MYLCQVQTTSLKVSETKRGQTYDTILQCLFKEHVVLRQNEHGDQRTSQQKMTQYFHLGRDLDALYI